MGARGFNIAEEGHVFELLPPQSISGGVTAQIFNVKNAAKVNIIIALGALAAAEGAVTLYACTDLAGDNPVAIGFDLYQQTTAGPGNDILGPRQAISASGFFPPFTPNVISVLHLQADTLPHEYPYLKLMIADGTNTDYASITAILSGNRYSGISGPSATT